jgi:hypothetical protein
MIGSSFHTPGIVKLWESSGRTGGLLEKKLSLTYVFVFLMVILDVTI